MWKKELLIRNQCEYFVAINSYEFKCDLVRDIWNALYEKHWEECPSLYYIKSIVSKFSF